MKSGINLATCHLRLLKIHTFPSDNSRLIVLRRSKSPDIFSITFFMEMAPTFCPCRALKNDSSVSILSH